MRIKTFVNGGYAEGGFTSSGGTMTGPLMLYADPIQDLEAATKQYVDNKFASIDASKFTSGILQVGRMPAFTGDITSTNGTVNITLVGTNIGVGTYSKVTVNDKGLVQAGAGLSESDLPDLPWSKIDPATIPRTLTGLGINDAVSINGDTITGYLTLNADPTTPNQIATKQYVDNASASSAAFKTGDIVTTLNNNAPAKFLRCNGGSVSRTAYADLYQVIGSLYTVMTRNEVGQPWYQQYTINARQTGPLGSWTAETSTLPYTVTGTHTIVTKNRIYLVGGNSYGNAVATSLTATIDVNGNIGAWTDGPSLPTAIVSGYVITTHNYAYIIGGNSTTGDYGQVDTIYRATINADGTLGAWSLVGNIPAPSASGQCVLVKNRIYVMGGRWAGQMVPHVYTAPVNTDGTLGTWTTDTPLPQPVCESTAVVIKDRIHFLGGIVSHVWVATNYSAPVNPDGTLGTWTLNTVIPQAVANGSVYVSGNTVYHIGGYSPQTNNIPNVYAAPIDANGNIGTWVSCPDFITGPIHGQVVATSSKLYMIGGFYTGGGYYKSYSGAVVSTPLVGGVNDYSPYYDGSTLPTDPNNFSLPDLTSTDPDNSYSFIKY